MPFRAVDGPWLNTRPDLVCRDILLPVIPCGTSVQHEGAWPTFQRLRRPCNRLVTHCKAIRLLVAGNWAESSVAADLGARAEFEMRQRDAQRKVRFASILFNRPSARLYPRLITPRSLSVHARDAQVISEHAE